MPDMDPVDRLALAQRVSQPVQAVTDHAENALYARLDQCFRDEVCDIVDPHCCSSFFKGPSEINSDTIAWSGLTMMFGAKPSRKHPARSQLVRPNYRQRPLKRAAPFSRNALRPSKSGAVPDTVRIWM